MSRCSPGVEITSYNFPCQWGRSAAAPPQGGVGSIPGSSRLRWRDDGIGHHTAIRYGCMPILVI